MKSLKQYSKDTIEKLSRSSGKVIAAPFKVKGVRNSLKKVLKGGWFAAQLTGNLLSYTQNELTSIVKEVRSEMKEASPREKGRSIPIQQPAQPTADSLHKRSMEELYEMAQTLDISGRSEMNKNELIQAIRNKQQ